MGASIWRQRIGHTRSLGRLRQSVSNEQQTTQRVKRPLPINLVHNICCDLLGTVKEEDAKQKPDHIKHWMALRDWAWLCLGFFCLLRKSEIINLRCNDFRFDSKGLPVEVRVRKSKQDAAGVGEWVPIPKSTGLFFDMRKLLRTYLNSLAAAGFKGDDFLITKYEKKAQTKKPYGKQGLWSRLRTLLGKYMSPDKVKEYGTHSLRRGGTTHYRTLGMPTREMQKLGRWRSTCFDIYDETDLRQVAYVQEQVLLSTRPWAP